MSGWTDIGKRRVLEISMTGVSMPGAYYLALFTDQITPGPLTRKISDLTEIATGNGYFSGGQPVTFDTTVEDNIQHRSILTLNELVWRATIGGPIPDFGDGVRFAALTDSNPSIPDREIWYYWDFGQTYTISPDQSLTFSQLEIIIAEG